MSTLKLVSGLAEQAVLEDILEASKPKGPPECDGLDYLLATPFRYRPYPYGSRVRRAGMTPGVWYGAEQAATAAAEMVFYRYLFYADSPATPYPDDAADYTAIKVDLATDHALDLTVPPFKTDTALVHLTDYSACQTLADTARQAGITLLRTSSVRDPSKGANLSVLTCATFAAKTPSERQSWRIRIGPIRAQAIRDFGSDALEFARADFAADPRLAQAGQSA